MSLHCSSSWHQCKHVICLWTWKEQKNMQGRTRAKKRRSKLLKKDKWRMTWKRVAWQKIKLKEALEDQGHLRIEE
ncbi:hypothetical protein L484_003522 [Morus notabilis]|uniref:Uncharacterized protein n=1 Tax=Morus notabilis TaxID=981085 RepID=W9SU15_9ROSA|nr:hypothetical protein L484_003522 [Morus notabilis]